MNRRLNPLTALAFVACSCNAPAQQTTAPRDLEGPIVERLEIDLERASIQTLWIAPNGHPWIATESGRGEPSRLRELDPTDGSWIDHGTVEVPGGISQIEAHQSELLISAMGEVWRYQDEEPVCLFGMGDIHPMSLGIASGSDILVASCLYYPRLLRFDLNDDTPTPKHAGASAFGPVWVFDDQHVIVGPGGGGTPSRFQGGDWEASESWEPLTPPEEFGDGWTDVWSPGDSRLWIVSHTPGRILHWTDGNWEIETLSMTKELQSVWGRGEFAITVGREGAIAIRGEGGWRELESEIDVDLFLARGTDDSVYIVGDEGTLLRLRRPILTTQNRAE